MTSLVKTITRPAALVRPAAPSISAQEFIAFYDELYPRVYTYVRYRCNDHTTADDLTASIFERALNYLDTYQSSIAPFSAWLFGIARNETNKYLRSLSTEECLTIEVMRDHPDQDPTPEEGLIERENYHELLSAMALLGNRERDLLGLKFASRFTNRQISEITSLTESNVGIIIYRAIHKLRKNLQSST